LTGFIYQPYEERRWDIVKGVFVRRVCARVGALLGGVGGNPAAVLEAELLQDIPLVIVSYVSSKHIQI